MGKTEETVKKQDIKIIRLAKWQIPKSKSVTDYMGDETFLSIGYFDMIDVQNVESRDAIHPLLAAYNASHRHSSYQDLKKNFDIMEEYTIQELIIFTDINEQGFSEKKIDDFWKSESPILYVSLIHIDNEMKEDENKESRLDKIIKKIQSCFAGREYLYYFSFDYSGIVILAKGMGLKEYLQLMFSINYENKNEDKLIRDSYSFYGFQKTKLKEYFEKFDQKCDIEQVFKNDSWPGWDEEFSVSVNIGIQNYNLYQEFLGEVNNSATDIGEYGLFGRHDISLVREKADLKWLIYIQYLLNKYTMSDNGRPADKLLSTHETFVKISDIGEFSDTERQDINPSYDAAKKKLDSLCDSFRKNLDENKYNGEYIIPVQAVKYSILSILKNRFAEDFVLCMYQSFCEFIEYLLEKMEHKNDDVMEFDECFNNYFRGLNSLVNSAMHSERQFIQATAFNAIIYDVPSKIMAFYIAVIDELQQLVRSDEDKKYTFLLTPSFSNEISVKVISYDREIPPHDRLLMVSINECSLYNPGAVIRRMAHEVAHFVGDKLRKRNLRKKQIKSSIIYIIVSHLIHGSFLDSEDLYDLIDNIEKSISTQKRFSDDNDNYSEKLLEVIPKIAYEFHKNPEVKKHIRKFIGDLLREYLGEGTLVNKNDKLAKREEFKEYLLSVAGWNKSMTAIINEDSYYDRKFTKTELEILTNLICCDIEQEAEYINRDRDVLMEQGMVSQSSVSKMGSGILLDKTVGEYVKGLKSIYSEAFADIQMVLLTGISYEMYLKGFLNEEKLEVDQLRNHMDDMARISMVTFALRFVGIWDWMKEKEPISGAEEELQKLKKEIETQIDILKYTLSADDKKEFDKYYGLAKKSGKNVSEITMDLHQVWELYGDVTVLGDNMYFYIYKKVFEYLLECIKISMEHYETKNMEKLQKTITTITKFEDVKQVFFTICDELQQYKQKVFELPTQPTG